MSPRPLLGASNARLACVLAACGRSRISARDVFADSSSAALAEAAAAGDAAGIRRLVAAGADPDAHGDDGVTPLQWALLNRSPLGLAGLLENAPLESAILGSCEARFRALLRAGVDRSGPDRFGDTPLHLAAKTNVVNRVLDLLEASADPRARNQRGSTFQRYLTSTPVDVPSEEGPRGRAAITSCREVHGVKSELR